MISLLLPLLLMLGLTLSAQPDTLSHAGEGVQAARARETIVFPGYVELKGQATQPQLSVQPEQ
jgi:hypothetical protein